jgi:hypothetical protein
MLWRGLTAAGLVIVAVVLVAGGRAQPAQTSTTHFCGAQDRQFIRAAQMSNVEIVMLGQDYTAGRVAPAEAIQSARNAALRVKSTTPRDPSLKLARVLMRGMFTEYGRAIRAQWKGGDAGRHMYRSYSLANYAHQVLETAEPALAKRGCSVADML